MYIGAVDVRDVADESLDHRAQSVGHVLVVVKFRVVLHDDNAVLLVEVVDNREIRLNRCTLRETTNSSDLGGCMLDAFLRIRAQRKLHNKIAPPDLVSRPKQPSTNLP